MSGTGRQASSATLLGLYRDVLLIRRAEERLIGLFADGEIPGFIHLGIGQEAVPVGIMRALTPLDTIASTHRGHGHAIAKGLRLDGFFAELLGKEDGLCRGRGGSMHVADMSVGMLGANGIVAAGSSIALGSALAHKTLGNGALAVAFFGDGALAEGLLHECFNLAALLKLPLLFVCENNGWSEFSPTERQIAFSLEGLARAHRLPHYRIDGNDVEAVVATATEVSATVRKGSPAVVECITKRVRGHFEGDAQKYRAAADLETLPASDPLRIAGERLAALGVDDAELRQVGEEVDAAIEAALAAARLSPLPAFEDAASDVYSPAGAA